MNSNPTISVIMSTYNTPDEWLEESINSILNQTYSNFEFIIVDDCSTTDMTSIKEKCVDDRIIWVQNEENIGLTKSLNKALKIAKGKYIARMDADDISLPERFVTQIEFMEKHPEVIVCGSWRRAIGNENRDEIWNIPTTREEQQVQLFFYNCGLTHPTAMFRKSMLDEFGIRYNDNYKKAQDYGIWVQCTRFAPMAMIHQVLLQYRKSDSQVTANKNGVRLYDSMVKTDQLAALGMKPTNSEKELHLAFLRGEALEAVEISQWVQTISNANKEIGYFDNKLFQSVLNRRWYEYCKAQYKGQKNVAYCAEYKSSRKLTYVLNDCVLIIKKSIKNLIGR